jgi:hypothetical protein
MIFSAPEPFLIFVSDLLASFFGLVCFVISLTILSKWDYQSAAPNQYALEKKAYLASTLIKYAALFKAGLFWLYLYALDRMSYAVPGAMCAAGLVYSSWFGPYLLILKILTVYLLGFWILIHGKDMEETDYPYTKTKFRLFAMTFPLMIVETVFSGGLFARLDPMRVVSCCGSLFRVGGGGGESVISLAGASGIVPAFYVVHLLVIAAYLSGRAAFSALINIIFLVVSIAAVTVFFSTYVYQLPSHMCPFCLLQKEYYYAGYPLYILLFAGTFSGIASGVIERITGGRALRLMRVSVISNTLFVVAISSYPAVYYLRNGVWL